MRTQTQLRKPLKLLNKYFLTVRTSRWLSHRYKITIYIDSSQLSPLDLLCVDINYSTVKLLTSQFKESDMHPRTPGIHIPGFYIPGYFGEQMTLKLYLCCRVRLAEVL
jgi:hypothetical protein